MNYIPLIAIEMDGDFKSWVFFCDDFNIFLCELSTWRVLETRALQTVRRRGIFAPIVAHSGSVLLS